uniref:Odorant binding protein n=1 Tax=Stomoxys calcitrans TaxID=35570 RepID=A0A1I8NP88_STOCA
MFEAIKYLIILLAVVVCISADDWKPKVINELKSIRDECLNEVPVTEDQRKRMNALDFPNEEAVRNFILCAVQKLGIYSTEHGYYADRLTKQFNSELHGDDGKEPVDNCLNNNPQGYKENDVYVYEMHLCLIEARKEHAKRHKEQ